MPVFGKLDPTEAVARALFEQAPVTMVMTDMAGAVQHLSSAAEQLFGYTREALIEKSTENLVPDGLPVTLEYEEP